MNIQPLSKERRDKINRELRALGPKEAWFTKGEMLEVLAAERYWREAVKNTPLKVGASGTGECMLCKAYAWEGPEHVIHEANCAWKLAQETV